MQVINTQRIEGMALQALLTDYGVLNLIRDVRYEEDMLPPQDMLLLKHIMPAVPILLLGFTALEGRELVRTCVVNVWVGGLGKSGGRFGIGLRALPHA
jgi:hypothetical protein